jgi:hypothetical protein
MTNRSGISSIHIDRSHSGRVVLSVASVCSSCLSSLQQIAWNIPLMPCQLDALSSAMVRESSCCSNMRDCANLEVRRVDCRSGWSEVSFDDLVINSPSLRPFTSLSSLPLPSRAAVSVTSYLSRSPSSPSFHTHPLSLKHNPFFAGHRSQPWHPTTLSQCQTLLPTSPTPLMAFFLLSPASFETRSTT